MKPALRYETEAALCADFIAWVGAEAGKWNRGQQAPLWTPYAETAGWDLLLVGIDGTQIGIQAKLRFNLKVLSQTLPSSWSSWREEGPDYRAILVPDGDSSAESLCSALGVMLFRPVRGYRYDGVQHFSPGLDLDHWNGGWHYWSPMKRHQLPAFVPDVPAGASGPVQLTKWKVAALRVLARLEIAGFVTKADFRDVGIDPRRWVGPRGWLVAGDEPGRFVATPEALAIAAQHPEVYPQVLADERAAALPRADLLEKAA